MSTFVPRNLVRILTHFVWGTQEPSPVLESEAMRRLLLETMNQIAKEKGYLLLCATVQSDHLHLIVELGKNQKVSRFAHTLQEMTAAYFQQEFGLAIRWHESFFAVSLSRKELPELTEYLTDHHLQHAHKNYREEYLELIHGAL